MFENIFLVFCSSLFEFLIYSKKRSLSKVLIILLSPKDQQVKARLFSLFFSVHISIK